MQNNRGTSIFRKSYLNDFIVIAIGVFFIAFFIRAWGDMHGDFNEQNVSAISLDAWNLLYYSLRTSMRFLLGMAWSLLFSVVFAVLAARYTPLRRVILPFVNFMESVPLVGFLTFTTVYFLNLYPHSVMGLECTAIFAVFTGQAWNMMLTLYQTLRIVPKELDEAARSFNYNPWQRFWRLEFIYSVPGLLWNAMVSQSAAWFALVASEAIPVGDRSVELPGVGSYIAEALAQQNVPAILYAIVALAANIVLLDQLVFRPLVRYTARFKYEDVTASRPLGNPWFYNSLAFSHVGTALGRTLRALADLWLFKLPRLWYALGLHRLFRLAAKGNWLWRSLWYLGVVLACVWFGYRLWEYFPKQYFAMLPEWMLLTTARVAAAMLLSVAIFTPLGVWIGMNPRLVKIFQPIIQILAAIPPNIFYPLIAAFIAIYHQDLGWWAIPMIMLGTQWYVLFNVIAGVSAIPTQITEVSETFGLRRFRWWRYYMLPAIFPYIVTGIISAAGGAWNSAIAAEVIQWGSTTLSATGLGAFISVVTDAGKNPESALGCAAMCALVALCIIFVWQPLYRIAETKFKYD
ncbi:Bicarbonate transport system permease protein CmpB [Serratia marcescens]|jgi:NitT/TauT family transport system permease protein|uniref:ABC transporter permease n=2 Tax=Serratia TaxID=613 RepID=UPI0007453259|nr:ABC transporter permease subunit [Serratia marcescens]APS36923.1 metal ABC transporter permease [Serratia marcescens]AQT64184.1 metal ABC transporter permease [Serratia marcescens]ASL90671.1 metal ABC transporter permease [Serratia marcescens]OHT35087.1 metal ABC transporter permease [Serratia marcescens]OHT36303.1 metal ABC transporter permease [Serratia marcescens]